MSSEGGEALVSELAAEFDDDLAGTIAEQVVEQLGPSLESMTPEEAVTKYFETRDLKPTTERGHRSSLSSFFLEWCDEIADIDDMSALTGSDLADYRVWRRDESSEQVETLSPKSEETQQKITRTFIKHCESWEIVRPELHEYVIVPSLDKHDEVRDEILDSDTAAEILAWLRKYEYADVEHVVWLLFASCGARTGGVHSLDLEDYVRDDEGASLRFRHRPETGTTLKNEFEGERHADIPDSVSEVLTDYVENKRKSRTDEYGRRPLLTTSHGRLSKSTVRNYIYAWTRPCVIGKECPYGRDPEECDAARRKNWAFKCPDSLSCHPVRKGYITAELEAGVPKAILSERCDVTEDVMEKHYDHRTEEEKMAARRVAMQLAHEQESRYGE